MATVASEVQGQVAVIRAETTKVRGQTDTILVISEMVCFLSMFVAGWLSSGLMVAVFGFATLTCVLGRIQIAISNVGQDIYQGLRDLKED